jgi:hypothetical protein
MITKIYLVENCFGDPNKVYIGKTKNNRLKDHKKKFGNTIEYSYIDEVDSLEHKNWEPLESYWIEQFKAWGFEVVNKRKKGGSGPEFQTETTKLKISNSTKGKNTWRKGILSPNSGGKGKPKPGSGCKNWTKEHLDNFRDSAKVKNKDFYQSKKWIESQQKQINQYDLEGNIIKEWLSIKQASKELNINRFAISNCLNNKQKTSGGFIWKYKTK